MEETQIHHLNDRTLKYMQSAQAKLIHRYFGLPGTFKIRLPTEIAFGDMEIGRADEFYTTFEGLLIDLEEESGYLNEKTFEKFSRYVIYASYRYPEKPYLAAICHKNPKMESKCLQYGPSLYIKVHFIYFSQEELREKYEKVINKVKQKEELTEMEALDMAFISKFISRGHRIEVIETLANAFEDAIIKDRLLKTDVGIVICAMIIKHVKDKGKQNKLLGKIDMRHIETEIQKLVYDEFGEEIEEIEKQFNKSIDEKNLEITEKDKKISEKNQEIHQLTETNQKYKSKIKRLNELGDLNNPEAKKILNSLLTL